MLVATDKTGHFFSRQLSRPNHPRRAGEEEAPLPAPAPAAGLEAPSLPHKAPVFGRLRRAGGERGQKGELTGDAGVPPPRRWERPRRGSQEGKRRRREGVARERNRPRDRRERERENPKEREREREEKRREKQ